MRIALHKDDKDALLSAIKEAGRILVTSKGCLIGLHPNGSFQVYYHKVGLKSYDAMPLYSFKKLSKVLVVTCLSVLGFKGTELGDQFIKHLNDVTDGQAVKLEEFIVSL